MRKQKVKSRKYLEEDVKDVEDVKEEAGEERRKKQEKKGERRRRRRRS